MKPQATATSATDLLATDLPADKRSARGTWIASLASVTMLSLCGPETNLWFLSFAAISPLFLISRTESRMWKLAVYASFFGYFFVSLQGLRYAHPLMIFPLIALAGYLAVYPLLFVAMLKQYERTMSSVSSRFSGVFRLIPLSLVAGVIWVGGEFVRNYFATGISVLMLGHSLAAMPSPTLIQIADCFGTYGVSFLIVLANAAVADVVFGKWLKEGQASSSQPDSAERSPRRWSHACSSYRTSVPIAFAALLFTHLYGQRALDYPTVDSETTFMLVGRDEQTEYQQDYQRELDIFSAYARQSIDAVRGGNRPIDAIVWPESMLSGGQPWYIAEENLTVPAEMRGEGMTVSQMRQIIAQTQGEFTRRSVDLVTAMKDGKTNRSPSIIGGCGVVRYGETAKQFSGVIHVGSDGQVRDTYAKNHLVMFGEYIPLIKSIPVFKEMVPPGLGLDAGTGPAVFDIGAARVLPNLCIETAVERITVNHMRTILDRDAASLPNVIVTLTNDAWFDHSAVVAHHLRCAQMVAIGCRRPILSAANGGPTAWIDSSGRVVEKLGFDVAGEITATPKVDDRVSTYVRHGASFAFPMGVAWIAGLLAVLSKLWRRRPFFRRGDR